MIRVLIFILYFAGVLALTIFTRIPHIVHYSLVPFNSIKLYYYQIVHGRAVMAGLENILGNLFLFAPFGYFMKKFRVKPFMAFMITSIVVIAIEVIQYRYSLGGADIDDYILNVGGAALTYLLTRKDEK